MFSRELKTVVDITNYRPGIEGKRIQHWKGIKIKDKVKEKLGCQGCQGDQTELF